MFARLGNYSMAIDYFKKAVENDPENVDFKANLAVAYYRTYKYDDAVRYYDQVKKKKPEMVSQLDFIESRMKEPRNMLNLTNYVIRPGVLI